MHWSEAELLSSHAIAEPLIVNGVRCHGGFGGDGEYVSPRTLARWPAIAQWQAQHRALFNTEIVEAPLSQWPTQFPSVEQSKHLLRHGVSAPTASMLTRIGTVEGFGGLIREVGIGDLQRHFADDLDGTALQHLETGLFETHARDEVGFGGEAGHKEMWFAARDIAFDHVFTEAEVSAMLQRMGFGNAVPAAPPVALCPEIDGRLESMLRFMIGLMFIEVSAFHTFAWAEELLRDDALVAGNGAAAKLVSYIRADETPHVAYLQTALTEVRDRSMHTVSGATIDGSIVIERIWKAALADSLGPRREQLRQHTMHEIEHALDGRTDGGDVIAEFHTIS